MQVAEEVAVLYAVVNGYLDAIPVEKVSAWEDGFCNFLRSAFASTLDEITTKKILSPEVEEGLKKAIKEFKI